MLFRIALVASLIVVAFAADGRADIDIQVANGQKVRGTIDPVTETETLTLCIPGGSTLTVTAKGKKEKGGNPAPAVTFKVFDGLTEISAGKVKEKGVRAKLKKLPIPVTGKYRVVIEAAAVGNYEARVKWKSPKKFKETVAATNTGKAYEFGVNAGATCSFQAKASKRSAALPVLESVDLVGGGTVHDFTPPGVGSKKHKEKGVLLEDFGDHDVFVSSNGPDGDVALLIRVKAPKTNKRQIVEISGKQLGSDDARGAVIGPLGGALSITEGQLGDLVGAAITVPPGALGKPTAIIIGSGFDVPVNENEPGGPAVFFGPEGLQFGTPAQIVLPFDPDLFNEEGDVQVAVRDEDGNIAFVSAGNFTVDLDAGTVSVDVSSFSTYQVLGRVDRVIPPTTVPGDLNGDTFADIVIPTGAQYGGALNPNNIQVIFGSDTLPSTMSTEFDVGAIFVSGEQFDEFGGNRVVADISGDGQDDLIVSDVAANGYDGAIYIFNGGPGFAGSATPFLDADVTIGGKTDSFESFGASLCVGDVIGDARLDLVVSSRGTSPSYEPVIYVWDGNNVANGLSPTADLTISGESFTTLLVRACGDLFGDAHDEIVLQQRFGDGGNDVYVVEGSNVLVSQSPATLAVAGSVISSPEEELGLVALVADLIGGAKGDLVLFDPGAGEFSSAIWVFQGGAPFGTTTVSSAAARINVSDTAWSVNVMLAADLDAGGRQELIIPDFEVTEASSRGGAAYIFRDVDLVGTISQANAFRRIDGTGNGGAFGTYAGMGDINHDGLPDVYFASPFTFTPPGDPNGAVHLFYGVPDVTTLPSTDSNSDVTIYGQEREYLGNEDFETPQ